MHVVGSVQALTASKIIRENRYISAIYRCAQSETPWYDVLDILCEYFELAKAVSLFSKRGVYRNYMAVEAETGLRSSCTPDPSGHRDILCGLSVGEAAIRETHQPDEVLGLTSETCLLGMDFLIGDDLARVRLYRDGHRPFLPLDAQKLQEFAVHITEAMQLARHICRQRYNLSFHDMALNRVSVGLIIVSSDDQLVWINRRAQNILDTEDGVRLINNQLRGCYQSDTARLWAAIRSAREDPDTTFAANVSRPRGEHDMSVMVIANPHHDGRYHGGVPEVGVFLRDTALRDALDPKVLKNLFGFTNSEIRLAVSLSEGNSLEDAAVDLGIKLATVRVHLRSMFGKLGVHRQSELIRRILV